MWTLVAQILVLLCFIFISILFSKDHYDVTGWILLLGIVCAIFTGWVLQKSAGDFLIFIPINSLVYLLFMDIFIRLLIHEHIFEYMAIRIIRGTKNRMRVFFYIISLMAALISALMEDLSVALILTPIVFRATKILKLDPKPYIYGVSASIIIGNLLTPIASPVNIIFATAFRNLSFDLDIAWFFLSFFILFAISLSVILILIDNKYLKNADPPEAYRITILTEIMNPNLLIKHKGRFFRYTLYLIIMLACITLNFYTYLIVAIGVIIICLLKNMVSHLF